MSPLILSAHTLQQQRSDMAHPFAQEPNFFYLTKIDQPDWKLVVVDEKKYLIAPEVDAVRSLFEGDLSAEEAREISGIDDVLTYAKGEELIDSLVKKSKKVYSLGPDKNAKYYNFSLNEGPARLWKRLKKQFKDVEDCRADLARMRAIKTSEEVDILRRAVGQTCASLEKVKKNLANFANEREVEAEFGYDFKRNGFQYAYEPIVASGANACTLHYGKNNADLPKDGFLLMDVGASIDGFNADITRTYALGVPSKRQVAVHDAVSRAHRAIIDVIAPGVSFKDYHERVDDIMKEVLAGLGLLNKLEDYRRYFPHAISHGLGIDVHESLGGYSEFMSGMVLTVEPGIYIPEEGIGVRIEDNILVTDDGRENLSQSLSIDL